MKHLILFLFTLLTSTHLIACQYNNTDNTMNSNLSTTHNKQITIALNPGEIFVSFVTNRKPNTDELFQSYLNTVFPVAMKHGAVPLANLVLDNVSKGSFGATDFIGLSKWPSVESAMNFSAEMPEEHLNDLRRPIWNDLKIFANPITEKMNITLMEGKTYEYKLVWRETEEDKRSLTDITKSGGKIIFSMPVMDYHDLRGNRAPQFVQLIEWDSATKAEDFVYTTSQLLKEEAFFTHVEIEENHESKIKSNHLSKVINASPREAWDILKVGGDVDKWFPFITSCKLIGEGEGAKRICTTADGKTLEESITRIDHKNRIIEYVIDKHDMEMPIKNIHGIMLVKERNGKALIDWTVEFELMQEIEEDMLQEMQNGMIQLMETGILGIQEYIR